MRRDDIPAEPAVQFLSRHYREEMPVWLQNFTTERGFDRAAFFASRVVYYPGSGIDGQPVQLFGQSRAAHCFVYADSRVSRWRKR